MKEKKHKILDTAEKVEEAVEGTVHATDKFIRPYRNKVLHRFPITFTLLVTSGVTMTFFGFERIISGIPWLFDRPIIILIIGIAILVLTGTLYKKL